MDLQLSDSQNIQYYTDLYQKNQISLSGLWYNIQTSLINLQAKEQRLQVQEERFQAQERKIQGQERKIQEIESRIHENELNYHEQERNMDIYQQHIIEKEAESCEYEKKELALKSEISDLKDELDTLKAGSISISNDGPKKSSSHISPNPILVASFLAGVTHKHHPYSFHAGSDTKCHELGTTSAVLTIDEALKVASRSKTVKGFSYNTKTKTAWFHWQINQDKVISASNCRPGQRKYKWHHLYIIS